jgi:hypothetical protein
MRTRPAASVPISLSWSARHGLGLMQPPTVSHGISGPSNPAPGQVCVVLSEDEDGGVKQNVFDLTELTQCYRLT